MNRMDKMRKRGGFRFMVLIPFSNERVAAASCRDLPFWFTYSMAPPICQETSRRRLAGIDTMVRMMEGE
jgi:hypothetical protein